MESSSENFHGNGQCIFEDLAAEKQHKILVKWNILANFNPCARFSNWKEFWYFQSIFCKKMDNISELATQSSRQLYKCESWGWWWCEMQSFSWENAILLANGKNAVTQVYRSIAQLLLCFREKINFLFKFFQQFRNCSYCYYCRYPRVTNLIYFEFQGNFSAKKDTFQETDVLL